MEEFFKNCLWVEQTADGFCPRRLTSHQKDAYTAMGGGFGARAGSCAGACISFFTDQSSVSFDYTARSISHDWVVFDIYENDVLVESIRRYRTVRDQVYYRRRNDNISKVTIYLPYDCEVLIQNLEIGEAMPAPKGEGKQLLLYGDSIMQGLYSAFPSLTLGPLLQRHFDGDILNQGVSDSCFDATKPEPVEFEPDRILVAYGTNDVDYKELPALKRDAKAYLSRIRELFPSTPVAVITPIWRGDLGNDEAYRKKTDEARYAIEEFANYFGMDPIDGYSLVPHLPQFFSEDTVHPNETGYAMYALGLIKQLEELDNL